eukprot:gene12685-3398_t
MACCELERFGGVYFSLTCVIRPSTSLDETSSPSGTLLPTKNPEKFTPLGNALERSQTYHNDGSVNDRSPGSNESFAERLTTMGMPSETAVLVDACDPSSAPGTPLVEPRLTRIHSDTTVVVRKPPSPANGEKAVITNRPMSLMPSDHSTLVFLSVRNRRIEYRKRGQLDLFSFSSKITSSFALTPTMHSDVQMFWPPALKPEKQWSKLIKK